MTRNRVLGMLMGSLALIGWAHGLNATEDPNLVVLESRVNAQGALINVLHTDVDVVAAQLALQFTNQETALLQLGDARRRDIEEILLDCALDLPNCLPPAYLISSREPLCTMPLLAPVRGNDGETDNGGRTDRPPHTHDTGFACPLRELLVVVRADIDAAQSGNLVRDYASANVHLAAADAARLAGDGWTAFKEACAAFKFLACPDA